MPGTLLVLDPAFNKTPEKIFLGGELAVGRKVVRVWTDNWNISNGFGGIFPSGAHAGAISFRNALKKYPGTVAVPTKVLTHSRGGSIAMKTIREWSAWLIANGVDPATVEIYICGCPDAKFTGASYVRPTVDPPVYPGNRPHHILCPTPAQFHGGYGAGFGLPITMTWACKVFIIIQEFDGWADAPAVLNTQINRFFTPGSISCLSRSGPSSPHSSTGNNYRKLLSDPTNVKYTDPAQTNVQYIWLRSPSIPSLVAAEATPNYVRNEYKSIYSEVLAGYTNRPVTLPMLEAA